jgi:MFS transporter, DHA1 family, inner membrane transport protein
VTIRQSSNDLPTWRLAVLAVGTFVLGVDGFVLPGLLPDVAGSLSVSVATAGQLTTAFAVAYAIGSPVIATVTGRVDRRTVITVGMGVFLVGMVLQAAGPSFLVVLAGRVVSALGAAAFQANAFALAGVLSRPERRARSFAVVGAGASLATVFGVPFGVFVGQWWGWRGAMWTIAALAAVAAVLATRVPSVVLPMTSLRRRAAVFADPRMLALLVVSALVLVPFYLVTSYVAPIVAVSRGGGSTVLVALLVFGVGFFVGNRTVGRLADRFGSLRVLTVALVATLASLAALAVLQRWFVPTLVALFLLGFFGCCLFIAQQNRVFAAGGDAAPVALGLNGSMLYVAAASGAALGGGVLSLAGVSWLAPTAAVVAAVALGVTWLTAASRSAVPRPACTPTAACEREAA